LVLVATPIGHLGDLSARAAEVLRSADLILCEDTRVTGKLLHHVGSRAPCWAVHAHNESAQVPAILERLRDGQVVALASDAGMPCLSDPGAPIVAAARADGHAVSVVPGPFAAAVALAGSGLQPLPFAFWGFLPKRAGARRARLGEVLQPDPAGASMTHVFYVPGRDLRPVLADIDAVRPVATVCVARELTKIHEEWRTGTASEVAARLPTEAERGEAVLLIGIAPQLGSGEQVVDPQAVLAEVRAAKERGLRAKDAVEAIARATGRPKREVYRLWINDGDG
jgi:16S rRNA (cytidine1402-2'-O)-methyltransferase